MDRVDLQTNVGRECVATLRLKDDVVNIFRGLSIVEGFKFIHPMRPSGEVYFLDIHSKVVDGSVCGFYFSFDPCNGVLFRDEPLDSDFRKGITLYYDDLFNGVHNLEYWEEQVGKSYAQLLSVLPYVMYRVYDTYHPHGMYEVKKIDSSPEVYLLNLLGEYYLGFVDKEGSYNLVYLPKAEDDSRFNLSEISLEDEVVLKYLTEYRISEVFIPDFEYKFYGKSGVTATVSLEGGTWRVLCAGNKGKSAIIKYSNGIARPTDNSPCKEVPVKYLRFIENYINYVRGNNIVWK